MFLAMLTVTVTFGVLRFVLPVEGLDRADVFKDLAHLWVGFLFGAAAFNRFEWPHRTLLTSDELAQWTKAYRLGWWMMPVGLTVLEVVAAIVRS